MGVVCKDNPSCNMKKAIIIFTLLYLILFTASLLLLWTFIQTDQYRIDVEEALSQSFEIQDRASQIHEQFNSLKDNLGFQVQRNDNSAKIVTTLGFLIFNLQTLLQLDYTNRYFTVSEINEMKQVVDILQNTVLPFAVSTSPQYDQALQIINTIGPAIYRLAGTTLAHSFTLTIKNKIEAKAFQNKLIGTITLIGIIIIGLFIYQINVLEYRKDQQIRSFTSLFAHMTRGRIAALQLFIDSLLNGQVLDKITTQEALKTINELDKISKNFLKSQRPSKIDNLKPLAVILDDITQRSSVPVAYTTTGKAAAINIPSSQFYSILEELISNAIDATFNSPEPSITVKTRIQKKWFLKNCLFIDIIDNGDGMSPELAQKALEPFFSTKSGQHTGLGLTGCYETLKIFGGELQVLSQKKRGTTMRIIYPIGGS